MQSENRWLKHVPVQKRGWAVVESIVEAVLIIIKERGISAVNTNRIAEIADLTPPSVYHFFANKDAILAFILERWIAEISSVYDRYDTDPELLAMPWGAFFNGLLQDWSSPSHAERCVAWDAIIRGQPDLELLDAQHLARHHKFMNRHFKRLGARGTARDWKMHSYYAYHIQDYVDTLAEQLPSQDAIKLKEIYRRAFLAELASIFE